MTRSDWNRWRWQWEVGRCGVTLDLSNLNLPLVNWYWWDETRGGLGFSYGNGNSDPVLSIDTPTFVPPRPLVRWLDWYVRRKTRR